MAEQLKSKAHVLELYRAAQECGVDCSKLSAENPFLKSGATAGMIQASIQETNPILAAEMRMAAGISPNLAAVAQLMSGGEIDDAARQSLFECDAKYAAEVVAQQKAEAAAFDQRMEQQMQNMRLNRFLERTGGDQDRAKHLMAQEDSIHAAQAEEQQSYKIKFAGN